MRGRPGPHSGERVGRALAVILLSVLLVGGVRAAHAVVAEGAGPVAITLHLYPAGQGRIDVTQGGAPVGSCDFLFVLENSSECTVTVAAATPVTLTAVPEPPESLKGDQPSRLAALHSKVPDYPYPDPTFVRWTVFGCESNPCTYTPDDGDWAGAVFTPLELQVGISGDITVSAQDGLTPFTCDGSAFAFGDSETSCHGLYPADSTVALEATHDPPDAEPITWRAGCDPDGAASILGPHCLVTMTNIRTFAVVGGDVQSFPLPFDIKPQVHVVLGGTGTGRVKGDGFDCGSECANTLEYQSLVTLEATADPGSHFVEWRGVCSTSALCSFSAGSATRVEAVFDGPVATIPTVTVPTATIATVTLPTATMPTVTLPTTSTMTTTTTPTVTTTATKRFLSAVGNVQVRRASGRRLVVLKLTLNRPALGTLRVVRRGHTILTRKLSLRPGRRSLQLALPGSLKPGRCQLLLRLVAGAVVHTSATSLTIRR